MDDLVASGIHFGHRVRSWNPKMRPYIYRKLNGIHIVNLKETVRGLIRAQRFVEMIVSEGQDVLFVGTKRQATAVIQQEAGTVNMPFVTERWLGGTLTNHTTLRKRLSRLDELERNLGNPELEQNFSKKILASMNREREKIFRNLNGVRGMQSMPGALVLIDINREKNALNEARRMGIPTIALVDTDSDPTLVDIVVPGNDDALKAIHIFLSVIREGIQRGLGKRVNVARVKEADVATGSEQPPMEAALEQA